MVDLTVDSSTDSEDKDDDILFSSSSNDSLVESGDGFTNDWSRWSASDSDSDIGKLESPR